MICCLLTHICIVDLSIFINRAYPENANFKTCIPSTLNFYTFCGLHETKKCWKFELDILNSSGVIATQKHI